MIPPSPEALTAAASAPVAGTARYRRIIWFASCHLITLWWFEVVLPRFGLRTLAARGRAKRTLRIVHQFRALALSLGGLMIKVGQMLSARADILPPEITRELANLQDAVPAVPFDQIRDVVESELGGTLTSRYSWFHTTPIASASLGQAHRAHLTPQDTLDTGLENVIVKVQRPGIEEVVAVDLRAIRRVAGWLNRVGFIRARANAPALAEEFARTSLEELNYLHEAANAERFAEMFATDPRVYAPEVVWERTTRRVLTLEDVTAIKITDVAGIRAAGIDPKDVARHFAQVMFEQVFEHRFVHVDPHPGNLFVTPLTGGDWRLTFIDFGMMTEVPSILRTHMRDFSIAAAARDSRGMLSAVSKLGMLTAGADMAELERALNSMFARFGGMGFAELAEVDPREFASFANEFGGVIREMPFQLPANVMMPLRATSLTSGLGSALDPRFNVWDALETYAAHLISEERRNARKDFGAKAITNASLLWALPQRLDDIIAKVDQGKVTFDTSRLESRLDRTNSLVRRGVSAVLFAGLLIGGSILLDPAPALGITLMSVSALPLLHTLFFGRRRS